MMLRSLSRVWVKCGSTSNTVASATPTYSPPVDLNNVTLVDGSMIALSPAYYSYLFAKDKLNHESIRIVSLGRKGSRGVQEPEKLLEVGRIHAHSPLLDLTSMEGSAGKAKYEYCDCSTEGKIRCGVNERQ